MREIKFRVWHSDLNEMLYQFTLPMAGNGKDVNKAFSQLAAPIMQFTGLKDKNGKDIYEGDVVKIRWVQTHWQTHRGDNIPNGFYTEPDISTIDTAIYAITFSTGAFRLDDTDQEAPNNWENGNLIEGYINRDYLLSNALDGMDDNYFEDDGYSTLADVKEACGIEVIGNIYENPELIK